LSRPKPTRVAEPIEEEEEVTYYTPTNALLYYNSQKVFTLKHLKCFDP